MTKLGMCVTVGRHQNGLHKFPSGRVTQLWCIKIYVAEPRKKDGKYTWRLREMKSPVTADGTPKYLIAEAKEYAQKHGMAYLDDIKQGTEVKMNELEMLALAGG